jgi:hypothetical protein
MSNSREEGTEMHARKMKEASLHPMAELGIIR